MYRDRILIHKCRSFVLMLQIGFLYLNFYLLGFVCVMDDGTASLDGLAHLMRKDSAIVSNIMFGQKLT